MSRKGKTGRKTTRCYSTLLKQRNNLQKNIIVNFKTNIKKGK